MNPGSETDGQGGRVLRLCKGVHTWVFRYADGEERALLVLLDELASRGEHGFDRVDAAFVSHRVARRLQPGVDRVDGTDAHRGR